MKITKEHYNVLKTAMQDKLNNTPDLDLKEYKESLKNDPRVKDIDTRLRWDLYHASGLLSFTCDTLYKYLDDSHIDTALKRIMKELGV